MEIKVTKAEWDCGDKRSYGSFEVEAETPLGLLRGKGMIGSGGEAEDQTWELGGRDLGDVGEIGGWPDLGMPHYYAGSRALDRYAKVKDQDVREALTKWLQENLGRLSKSRDT